MEIEGYKKQYSANSVPHSTLFNMFINYTNKTKSMLITVAQSGKQN